MSQQLLKSDEYWKVQDRADKLRPINIFLGGRGIGKTYSVIDECMRQYDENGSHFMYLRNQQNQIELSAGIGDMNPFNGWNKNHNRNVYIKISKKIGYIIEDDKTIGIAAALSTFNNLRGASLENGLDNVILDEFIQRERNSGQFQQFINMLELVNRNKELEGRDPCRVFLLSNAQTLSNEILDGLGLIDQIAESKMHVGEFWQDDVKYVELCKSNISDAKKRTVVARLLEGNPLYDEYYNNQFVFDDMSDCKKRPLGEYTPVFMIDDRCIYQHKSRLEWYVTKRGLCNLRYNTISDGLRLISERYMQYKCMKAENKLIYEKYSDKLFMERTFGI